MSTKTATFIRNRELKGNNPTPRAQKIYRLDPPIPSDHYDRSVPESFQYVVVSAAEVMYSGPETYIFGSDESGEILSFSELEGSFQGALDHEQALRNAGYEVFSGEVIDGNYTVSSIPLEIEGVE
jgi:hypothetical protein